MLAEVRALAQAEPPPGSPAAEIRARKAEKAQEVVPDGKVLNDVEDPAVPEPRVAVAVPAPRLADAPSSSSG